jgi:hypothetical protein
MKVTIKADPSKRGDTYLMNLGEAASQLLAALVGLNANLTFSAYCGYWNERGFPYLKHLHKGVDALFRDPTHCSRAWANRS